MQRLRTRRLTGKSAQLLKEVGVPVEGLEASPVIVADVPGRDVLNFASENEKPPRLVSSGLAVNLCGFCVVRLWPGPAAPSL